MGKAMVGLLGNVTVPKRKEKKTEKIFLSFSYDQFLKNIIVENFEGLLSRNETLLTDIDTTNSTLYEIKVECKVVSVLNEAYGKLGDSNDNFVLLFCLLLFF